jgi:trk/ktr system potassium uptake protein
MFVIVVGGGKVGHRLAQSLVEGGHTVRLVESNPVEAERLRPVFSSGAVTTGSGSDPAILEGCGARHADVVAAVTGDDETNLVVTSLARLEFNVARVIGRVNDPRNAWLFTSEMGVDLAINQADLIANLIAEEMSLGDMMTLLKLRKGQYSLVEEKIAAPAPAAGRALGDLPMPPECSIVAVIRKGELLIPNDALVLQPVDEVLALAHRSQLKSLAALLGGR